SWIISQPNESVEYSSFIVKTPPLFDIRYRELNIELKPVIETLEDKKMFTWTTKNIPASKYEDDSYTSYNLPKIEIVPQTFEYDGYKGELKSWQSFGAWCYQLFEEVKPFNKEDIEKIQALVVDC